MKKQRFGALALAGVFSALAVIFLLITTTNLATVGTVALAAVCAIPVVTVLGQRGGLIHFAAVALLAWLLVPPLEGKVLYTAFFGWYTVFKAWLEQKNLPRTAEWSIKIAVFLIALCGGGAAWYYLLTPLLPTWAAWWMLPIGGAMATALFVVYDRCLTGLVGVYIARLQPTLRRLFQF